MEMKQFNNMSVGYACEEMKSNKVSSSTISTDVIELLEQISVIKDHVNTLESVLYGAKPQGDMCEEVSPYDGLQHSIKRGLKETDRIIGTLVSIRNELH
jgi:hypothetical protein